MSAYVCGACHLTALAAYAVWTELYFRTVCPADHNKRGDAQVLAQLLYVENVKSVSYRYPGKCSLDPHAWPIRCCRFALRRRFTELDILKAVHCYSHQADEHPGWEASKAKEIADKIEARAEKLVRASYPAFTGDNVRDLPEYEGAEWGIRCDHTNGAR